VVGLLGKNGAGKTTLLKCAMGLLRVNSGTSKLFGEDSWKLSGETKARIGYVPQELDLYTWMRVRHMIAYIAAFYPQWNHLLVSSLVAKWELETEDTVAKLSEGQKQKLGLILAMGHQPELLVLDEPAASLDPQARRTFLSTVIDIAADENRTVVLYTHLTSDLERVASDIVMLKSGTVSYCGPMDALKDSVKTLKLTSRMRLPRKLDFPGILSCETDTNEALLTVQGVSPDLIRELEAVYNADIEVRDLNLEDIFVEVHRV
jgi:ABC-2 type transport system ATP-binding protein